MLCQVSRVTAYNSSQSVNSCSSLENVPTKRCALESLLLADAPPYSDNDELNKKFCQISPAGLNDELSYKRQSLFIYVAFKCGAQCSGVRDSGSRNDQCYELNREAPFFAFWLEEHAVKSQPTQVGSGTVRHYTICG